MKTTFRPSSRRLLVALVLIGILNILSLNPTTFALIKNNFVYTIISLVAIMTLYDCVRFFFLFIVPTLCNFGLKLIRWRNGFVNEASIHWNSLFCTEYRTIVVVLMSVLVIINTAKNFEMIMRAHALIGVFLFILFLLSNVTLWSGAFAWRIHYVRRRSRKRPTIDWRLDNSREPARRFKPRLPKSPE